jgi:V8-like Glu-specific endopeptidase
MVRIISIIIGLLLTGSSFAGNWLCTSFFINDQGYVVTAGHCVKGAKELIVVSHKVWYNAKLVVVDYDNDVAILKIDKYTPDHYNAGSGVNADKKVYILGYPIPDVRGYNLKIKTGYIAQRKSTFYQIAGGTCQGNSGGPVVNSSNDVVGILSFGYGSTPCAYYVGAMFIDHVLILAQIFDIPIQVNVAGSAGLFTEKEVYEMDVERTPILLGSG